MPGLVRALRARFALAGAVVFVSLAALPHAAFALTVPMGITELSRAASAVVIVHAAKSSAHEAGAAVPGRHRAIFTDVPLQVTSAIVGDKGAAFTLSLPGGEVGGLGYYVSDTPTLTAGGRYVLFLDGQGRVIGGEQGCVPVDGGFVSRFGMSVAQLADAVQASRSGSSSTLAALPLQALVAETATGATLASTGSSAVGAVSVAAVTPAITSISPAGVAAGIGSTVTITGSGFGSSQGTVKFTDGNTGSATVVATVSSWSDTQIVAAVPQGAAGGSVVVTTSLGASSTGYSYDVSFSTDGRHFLTLPVNYYINEGSSRDISSAEMSAQIQAAMATWGAAGTNFAVRAAGTTAYTADFFTPGAYAPDGMNEAFFYPLPYGYLAVNEFSYYKATGQMFESDIAFNSNPLVDPSSGVVATWVSDASSPVASGYAIDLQSIALHELGHTVGLDDQYVNYQGAYSRVMGAYVYNSNRRALTSNETSGALYLYGTRPSVPAPDLTAPTTSVSPAAGAYATPLTVTLGASDDRSGVSATYYSLDGGASWVRYAGPFALADAGVRTVSYYSIDGAGNAEKPSTVAYTLTAPVPPRTPGTVARIDGADRWSVATNAALAAFPGWAGVTDVVIASGEDRAAADPLAAAGLAGAYKAPVLLVASKLTGGKVPGATEAALAGIRAANGGHVTIHVVGGTTSIPATVYKRLAALKGGGGIERISGSDRYALSVALANRTVALVGAANVPGVLIANGEQSSAFFDALAASPISYATHRPLLIVRAGSVPGAVANALATTFAGKPRVAVNSTALLTAGAAAGAGAAERMASSADRYTAATQIADFAVSRGWLGSKVVGVANKLPDALTGGSALGRLGGPVLYTPASPLAAQTSSWLRANLPGSVLVAGGTISVAESTLQSARAAVQ